MNIDELQERLDKELTNIYKNVLINGEWGIGKTYFINNYSKDKNSIYISLFGIDSLESFIFNIYLQIDSKIQGFFRKLNLTFGNCEDSVVFTHSNIVARVVNGTTLANNDIARDNGFTAEFFNAQTTAFGIASVVGTTA